MKPIRIAHLFPDLLNLYADKGNILTLRRRLAWRGIPVEVEQVRRDDPLHLSRYHLVLLGGGSDREQALVGEVLRKQRAEWASAVASGLPLLAICGGYQLLGEYYETAEGLKVPGLGLLDMRTTAGSTRLIGNIAIESPECGRIVGFENHAGRTEHRHLPLGTVLHGHGNNGQDGKEGVRYQNVIGTYIHGPLLPKNPRLADFVLQLALAYAGAPAELSPLDDALELLAHEAFFQRRIVVGRGLRRGDGAGASR
ncbi:glutamine amidotransferase [Alicyclobacillus cellulosilyticus]|uniref:Lipid II isoglutaminyl synthase (glutamine-hydrolyzing) subunit GatD n=1 Tax=Alicyclobacillus cellulosilyticus TaxID=1003997 RepID=A0A917NG35_9BACL|nr:glutamine amidotransferase [Alicyclobacillus cellulosilyticus]GGI97676.1 glutamine amidotransferase [Alicyclobacillus cellulosilyticus]